MAIAVQTVSVWGATAEGTIDDGVVTTRCATARDRRQASHAVVAGQDPEAMTTCPGRPAGGSSGWICAQVCRSAPLIRPSAPSSLKRPRMGEACQAPPPGSPRHGADRDRLCGIGLNARCLGRPAWHLGAGALWQTRRGRPGMSGRFVTGVVSVGQEPAGGGAPVDRAARRCRCCRLAAQSCRRRGVAVSRLGLGPCCIALLHLRCRSGRCGGGPAASDVDWLADWGDARPFVILTT
jgi:hypothetical protein